VAKIDVLLQGFSLTSDQGSIAFCGVTLVEGTKRILVDSGHVGRRSLLLQRLRERGLGPDDIDCVFLSHAHWDHVLNIDLFPRAKVLIHPLEREYCRQPHAGDWATPSYTTTLLESRQLQEVMDGEEIDDGVRVLATPGHSRGSMALLVEQDGSTAAVSGDALPYAASVRTGLPRLAFWDVEEARRSVALLLERAQAFYPGHDRPFRVMEGGRVSYLQPARINLTGWPEPDDSEGALGLSFGPDASRQTQLGGNAVR
jgi:N-acyl homoserine lactone hydrolase